jgi:hypothetical protein
MASGGWANALAHATAAAQIIDGIVVPLLIIDTAFPVGADQRGKKKATRAG